MNELNATPHAELIAELMNPNNPKNEREHAAVREIERLQEALADMPESTALQLEPAWPPATPPAHGRGWPLAEPPLASARGMGCDSENSQLCQCNKRELWERCDQKFAELIRADEREACAKVLESISNAPDMQFYSAAIRARGNT